MAIVPLGVDTKAFRPTKRPMRKSISFIYVGTLNKNRRLQSMLEAFEMVYQDYPDVRLLIAGAGNDRMNLEAWTRKRRLQEAIKFLDRIDHREVPGLVQQADCGLAYVPITPWFQPQPQLKTLEYLAAGLPVVATATAGNAALWNSLPKPLLTSDEPQEFAAGLRYAVENISELAKINFRKVALRYEWSTVVRRNLLPFYQEVFKGQ